MNEEKRIAKQKEELLAALAETCGIVASACKKAGLSRQTFYQYCSDDPEFKAKAEDVKELQKDFAESLILKKMKEGDTSMIIFYAKTQMKDRGYYERKEITGKDGEPLHAEVNISDLTDQERQLLLNLGQRIINKKE